MTDYSAIIRDHLTQQRFKAQTDGGTCQYRYGTNKCAVGCLIPDDKYTDEFEGLTLYGARLYGVGSVRGAALLASLPPDLDLDLAEKWQQYHDGMTQIIGNRLLPRDGRFCYSQWLEGDQSQSPAEFYEALKYETRS